MFELELAHKALTAAHSVLQSASTKADTATALCAEAITYIEQFQKYRIASVWDVEDVQSIRPDLDDAQALKVLHHAKREHDAETGLNWQVLEYAALILFPEVKDTVQL